MSLWSCNDLMRALKEYVANERINICLSDFKTTQAEIPNIFSVWDECR
ncbi:hypothetical protein FNE42_05195 [Helicobacter pylori]|nr:hypothetical protein FNE42_05195 [Helicobacter pylori]